MKLFEIENFLETLSILFNHFMKYNIKSSLQLVADYGLLFEKIMKAEFVKYTYLANINSYNIDFLMSDDSMKDNVFIIMCKDLKDVNFIDIHIDFSGSSQVSFIKIEFSIEKHPPFVKGLLENEIFRTSSLNEPDIFIETSDSKILSLSEFTSFIDEIVIPRELRIVEIE
jgi:hypothetical protein